MSGLQILRDVLVRVEHERLKWDMDTFDHCAIGNFVRSPEGQQMGLHFQTVFGDTLPVWGRNRHYWRALGIGAAQASFLFSSHEYPECTNIQPADVIARVDWLLSGNQVQDHPDMQEEIQTDG